MRLKSLFIVVMLFVAMVAQAQQLQEVVYLKNGSIIRGVIIEQVPNESLKIQTSDGSIFAYSMDEVERITKEQPLAQKATTITSYSSENYSSKSNLSSMAEAYGIWSGYRGFVDLGYSVGVGDYGESRVELTTSHGYQIIPYLFVGLGVGVQYYHESELWEIPIYVHLRGSLPCHAVCQPFIDWKIGYTVYDADGFYMCPSVGCRFAVSDMCGLSLSLGYTYQSFEYWRRHNCGGFTIKVGLDF